MAKLLGTLKRRPIPDLWNFNKTFCFSAFVFTANICACVTTKTIFTSLTNDYEINFATLYLAQKFKFITSFNHTAELVISFVTILLYRVPVCTTRIDRKKTDLCILMTKM